MTVTYTTLTVGRASTAPTFTVRGYTGALVGLTAPPPPTVDLAFLTEAGDFLTAETGDILLTA